MWEYIYYKNADVALVQHIHVTQLAINFILVTLQLDPPSVRIKKRGQMI